MVDLASSTTEQSVSDDYDDEVEGYEPATSSDGDHFVQARCTVTQPMNGYGALTLRAHHSNRTFQVVECATQVIRRALAHLWGQAVVSVRLVPLTGRGNTWRAVGVMINS